ncbi:hypothetical protein ACQPW1_15010 [Nocardia sp. CA-128927]|uniref:hypothetical protein n=1 Tax=Nocardia sp. CA-128927 TaxID=3239975 RepID=UPI003D974320
MTSSTSAPGVAPIYQPRASDDATSGSVGTNPTSIKVTLAALAAQPAPAEATTATPAATTTQHPAPTTPAVIEESSPTIGGVCNPSVDNHSVTDDGQSVKCPPTGGTSSKWVRSEPVVGTREPGSPCTAGQRGIAVAPDGKDMFCVGTDESAHWSK